MASKIVTLKDHNNDIAYPVTPVDAVFVDNNTTLSDELAEKADTDLTNVDAGAVTTAKIANGAVISQKIDFTTFPHIVSCGRVNIGTISAYNGKNVTINIPTQPDTNYYVAVSYSDGGAEFASCGLSVNNRTTTDFTINCYNTTASQSGNLSAFYIVTRND